MSTPAKLRFRARGTALVPHYEREQAGIRCFVGRKFVEVQPGQYGFEPMSEAAEVPYRSEYVKHCADGDLEPADEATAKACGVEMASKAGKKA